MRQAVREGVARWPGSRSRAAAFVQKPTQFTPFTPADETVDREAVIGSIPRRRPLAIDDTQSIPLRTRQLTSPFRNSFFLALRRMFVWLYGTFYFIGGTLWDKIRRRDSRERQAVRLREMFTKVGGTFIKFGQQAAIRVDLLPYVYCEELSKLLDKVDPFPVEEAIDAIERVTGKPLGATFQVFDPEPIGSASIACVYQAILHNGDKVAVKVRRPGIGEQFVADFRVLGWMFGWMEFLTIVRPGYTKNVLEEVRATLMEELDFYKEARFTEIFRRRAKTARRPYFTAPGVYPELSGEDVIVEEFVSGIWLSELLSAVESNDQKALDYIASQNIDPKIVARRLLWAGYWGLWESVFFHADPHPANVIVQPNNELVFIDFGSMGYLTNTRRMTMQEILNLEEQEDLEAMARLSLRLLEPLPPIDTDEVLHAVEETLWDAWIGSRSEYSEWWEKTSAQLWLGFFKVTSRYQIPMSFDTVRMIRATLLYDTLAARLDNDINIGEEYRAYMEDAGREAQQRLTDSLAKRLEDGLTGLDYLRLEKVVSFGDRLLYQSGRFLNLRPFNFAALIGKFVTFVIMSLSLIVQLLVTTAVITVGTALILQWLYDIQLSLGDTVRLVVSNFWYQILMLILIVVNLRRIMFRLRDKEIG